MAGAAAAPLVPWRGLIEPLIFLPARHICSSWCNLHPSALTEESLEYVLVNMRMIGKQWILRPTQLIVSPTVKHLIDTDPVVRHAAELVLGRKL